MKKKKQRGPKVNIHTIQFELKGRRKNPKATGSKIKPLTHNIKGHVLHNDKYSGMPQITAGTS